MTRLGRRLLVTGGLVVVFVGGPAAAAWAHPLGNFTENRADAIVVGTSAIAVEHVLDLAEIPTLQARPAMDSNGDGQVSPDELAAFSAASCARSATTLTLAVDGQRLPLSVVSASGRLVLGQAGLFTLRLECATSAHLQVGTGTSRLSFADDDRAGTVGWREVTIQGDGTTLIGSNAPTTSPSKVLRGYPQDALTSPVDVSTATTQLRLGGPALAQRDAAVTAATAVLPGGLDTLTSWLSSAATGATGTWTFALAVLIAVGVGAAHAVAPGHGKSIMAFYLAGRSERSLRAATQVALTVTVTHTFGVLLLGLLVGTFATLTPASLYPWLTAVSGLLVIGVGATLLRFSLRARRAQGQPDSRSDGHSHGLGHGHGHSHGDTHSHPHPHPHPHASEPAAAAVAVIVDEQPHPHEHQHPQQHPAVTEAPGGRRGLVALGIAGGLVPSPSALIVLLGTAAIGRAWFGVLLVLAFGIGMAITLAGAGLLAHRAATGFGRLATAGRHPWVTRTAAVLPLITASAVLAVGASLAVRGLAAV